MLASGPNYAPNMAYIGWGVYVMATVDERREEEEGRLVGWRPILAARTSRCGCRPIRRASSPTATRHFNYDEWEAAGYDRAFVEDYLGSNLDSYNHPNAAIEPRIPGIFQYYSIAEDELAKGYAGQYKSAPGNRRCDRRRLGEDHRPDRPRQPDQRSTRRRSDSDRGEERPGGGTGPPPTGTAASDRVGGGLVG